MAGGYRLGAGIVLPPLLLDDAEAVAVAVALRSSAGGGVAGIEETSVRALVKLEQVLPSRLRRRVHALQAFTIPVTFSGPTVDPPVLAHVAAACRDYEVLRIDYRKQDGTESARGGAATPGPLGTPLVPGRVGPRSARLAHLSGRSAPSPEPERSAF